MPVKVIDRDAQQEIEVSPEELQADIESGAGRFAVPGGKVLVAREGNRTGSVDAADLEQALADGWQLSDAERNASATMQREESDLASQLQGAAEAGLSGVSLGLSSAALEALGADPARMAARRQALGSAATVAELAGAVAPALLTGGASAAGTAAGTGARLGARGALRYTPAGLLETAGAAVERGTARALAGAPRMARVVAPVAGRGAVEGAVSAAGAQLHEDVLGERGVAVDRLLGAGAMGALFGGGVGALVPGAAAAAVSTAKLPVAAARKVLNRASGIADDVGGGHVLERALADGNVGLIAKITGAPEEAIAPLLPRLRTKQGRAELGDLLESGGSARLEERLAQESRQPIVDVRDAVADLRKAIGRRNKTRGVAEKLEPERRGPAIQSAVQQIDDFGAHVELALQRNAEFGGELYEAGVLKQLKAYSERARREVEEAVAGARAQMKRGVADYDAHSVGLTYRAVDSLKQDADALVSKLRTSAQRSGSITSQNTLDVLLGQADDAGEAIGSLGALRRHLEDEQVWGAQGLAQKESNAAVRDAIATRRGLADSASKRLLDATRDVDNRDLLSVVRSSARFSGEQVTEKFRATVAKEVEAARTVARHYELTPDQLATLDRAEQALARLDDSFAKQRDKVQTLDAVEMLRSAEGNRSVSITDASSIGAGVIERGATAAGAAIGSMAGPAGALAGAAIGKVVGNVAGLARRPYSLLRQYTAIMRQIDKGEGLQLGALGGFAKSMGGKAKRAALKAGPAAARAGAGARAAATRAAGISSADRRRANDEALDRARAFAANPSLLAEEMRGASLGLDGVAPMLAAKAAERTAIASAFLVSKAPTEWSDPLGRVTLTDPHSRARFDRYAEAVLRPMDALARLADGTFSLEHAEALREVYPSLYEDVQRRVMQAMIEADSIPYATRIQAGVLFQEPADATVIPEMLAATQQALAMAGAAQDQREQQSAIRASGAQSLRGTAALNTGASRIEGGGART